MNLTRRARVNQYETVNKCGVSASMAHRQMYCRVVGRYWQRRGASPEQAAQIQILYDDCKLCPPAMAPQARKRYYDYEKELILLYPNRRAT